MNFVKSVARKRLPECLPSVINVFLNTGKKSEAGRDRCVMGSVVVVVPVHFGFTTVTTAGRDRCVMGSVVADLAELLFQCTLVSLPLLRLEIRGWER